jgi:hypothetical protein
VGPGVVSAEEEVLVAAVSMVVGSAEEASAAAVSTAVVVSVGLISAVALSGRWLSWQPF